MYQTLWIHSSTWHHSNRYIQNIVKLLFNMTSPNIMMLMCTKHYEAFVLYDSIQYRYVQDIMKPLFYMTPPNIMMLMCTKYYGALVLQCYFPMFWRRWCALNIICAMFYMTPSNTDIYQTLWIEYSTWHLTISWHWCVPNIMKPLFYMTRYNIMTLICSKHYEFIVLHDTLQYPDADMYQTLWSHCSTWHRAISWHWCVPSIMKPLFYMTRYNIMTLICTKHYEAIVLDDRF
jgi:hypothetical protein